MKIQASSLLLILLTAGILIGEASPKQVLFLGGKGRTKVQVLNLSRDVRGNCSLIPDVPFDPQLAIGLRDKDGRAMVCGGNKNPSPKSCHILDRTNNIWIPGPNLKRKREGASVTCLDNGVCWVFGGKSTSFTEWYNPDTNEFEIGPEMPVNSVHGLCTTLAPSGTIYMFARREPGKTKTFTFDPNTGVFNDTTIPDLEGVEKRYAACHLASVPDEGDVLFMSGGGSGGINSGTTDSFLWFEGQSAWKQFEEPEEQYPHAIYGSVAIRLSHQTMPPSVSMLFAGGITPSGEEPRQVYTQEVLATGIFYEQLGLTLEHPPGAFPIVVTVDDEDCPMEPPCGV